MDKEKLEKAAINHAKAMGDIPEINSIHAFKAGAEWLQSQPLADRLNPEEMEEYRALHKTMLENEEKARIEGNKFIYDILLAQRSALIGIFGKEMFEK